jgi:N-acetylmuramoyl-L-alanine amidase
VDIINASNARCFVSIHVNSNPGDGAENGSSVFYRSKRPETKVLAACIQEELNLLSADYNRKTHLPQPGKYYILGYSKIPGVIIESGFITNSYDRQLLTSEAFLKQLAGAVADGIDRYTAKAVT